MPEPPEVETVRKGLERHVVGRTIAEAAVLHPRAVRRHVAGAEDFSAALRGRTITAARRRGEYLWLPVAQDALLAHLGMSGSSSLRSGCPRVAACPGHLHLRRFRPRPAVQRPADVRPPGPGDRRAELPSMIAHIAPDPMEPAFDLGAFIGRLRGRRTGIKRALLDQSLVSGIGNIYADEALWRARLHWARNTGTLTRPEVIRVVDAVRGVLGMRWMPAAPRSTACTSTLTGKAAISADHSLYTGALGSPACGAAPRSGGSRS